MPVYSVSASAATTSTRTPKPSGSRHTTSAPTSGSATTAVSTRSARFDIRVRSARAADLFARAAEASLAAAERLEGPVQLFLPEVRPIRVGEVELGVGRLPEEEVRQPL